MLVSDAAVVEKGGGSFAGIKLLLCENPLPPLDFAVEAAARELPRSNYYTEQFSQPLREAIARYCGVGFECVHVNSGSEIILRQLVSRFGERVHLVAPTFALFEEIGGAKTHTYLDESQGFRFDPRTLEIPAGTTLSIIVNPNNPNGLPMELSDNVALIQQHPETLFLVDEAFIEFGGRSVTELVPSYSNLIVTRTFSKAFSVAGLRVGYAVAPRAIADWLNTSNDAYPLSRPSQAAALACLDNLDQIRERVALLKTWTQDLAAHLEGLGITTFPTATYYFLGKLPGVAAERFAAELRTRDVLVKPLHQAGPGGDFIRFTTSTPENNARALAAIDGTLRALRHA